MTKITPILLCGGVGKRLWPVSRKSFPKQFHSYFSDKTLFQDTLTRVKSSKKINFNDPLIVTHQDYRFIVLEQMEKLKHKFTKIFLEPYSKNTAPSILAADFGNLQRDCEMINSSEADWFHIDIMDGVFVPNISFGMPVVKCIDKICKKTMDIHLMIINHDKYINKFKELGADILTVHFEVCNHLHRTIHAIKQAGMKAGIALNPHTPVNVLSDILEDLDLVCIMSVNPGFGEQSFIENTYNKVEQLRDLRNKTNSNFLIEIDGGVNLQNAPKLLSSGADVLVAGSFVFKSENPTQTISELKSI